MQNAVVRVGIDEVALDNEVVTSMSTAVSHRLDDWKVTNQKKSGRCWLFAALNLVRSGTRRKLGLKDFEFSQNYAMYYDKLERANYFFESIIETADQERRRPAGRLPDGQRARRRRPVGHDRQPVHQARRRTQVGDAGDAVVVEHLPDEHHAEDPGPAGRCRRCASWSTKGAERRRAATPPSTRSSPTSTPCCRSTSALRRREFDWQWMDDEKQFHRDGDASRRRSSTPSTSTSTSTSTSASSTTRARSTPRARR